MSGQESNFKPLVLYSKNILSQLAIEAASSS